MRLRNDPMTTYFDLWDIDTGTSLGTYNTLAEVVSIALELSRANGSAYADDLEIGYRDDMGTRRVLLDGKRLLWLATHTPIPDGELSVAGAKVGIAPRDPDPPAGRD
jgi:hypothetical protein